MLGDAENAKDSTFEQSVGEPDTALKPAVKPAKKNGGKPLRKIVNDPEVTSLEQDENSSSFTRVLSHPVKRFQSAVASASKKVSKPLLKIFSNPEGSSTLSDVSDDENREEAVKKIKVDDSVVKVSKPLLKIFNNPELEGQATVNDSLVDSETRGDSPSLETPECPLLAKNQTSDDVLKDTPEQSLVLQSFGDGSQSLSAVNDCLEGTSAEVDDIIIVMCNGVREEHVRKRSRAVDGVLKHLSEPLLKSLLSHHGQSLPASSLKKIYCQPENENTEADEGIKVLKVVSGTSKKTSKSLLKIVSDPGPKDPLFSLQVNDDLLDTPCESECGKLREESVTALKTSDPDVRKTILRSIVNKPEDSPEVTVQPLAVDISQYFTEEEAMSEEEETGTILADPNHMTDEIETNPKDGFTSEHSFRSTCNSDESFDEEADRLEAEIAVDVDRIVEGPVVKCSIDVVKGLHDSEIVAEGVASEDGIALVPECAKDEDEDENSLEGDVGDVAAADDTEDVVKKRKDVVVAGDSEDEKLDTDDELELGYVEEITRYECLLCGQVFASQSTLRKHVRGHMFEFTPSDIDIPNDNSLTEEAGGSTEVVTDDELDLPVDVSEQTSDLEKKLRCSICVKPFQTVKSLKRHNKFHSKHKGPSCKICGNFYQEEAELLEHIKELYHDCKICGKYFLKKTDLREHVNFIHLKITFDCKICNKSYPTNESLRYHVSGEHFGTKSKPRVIKPRVVMTRMSSNVNLDDMRKSLHWAKRNLVRNHKNTKPDYSVQDLPEKRRRREPQRFVPEVTEKNKDVVHKRKLKHIEPGSTEIENLEAMECNEERLRIEEVVGHRVKRKCRKIARYEEAATDDEEEENEEGEDEDQEYVDKTDEADEDDEVTETLTVAKCFSEIREKNVQLKCLKCTKMFLTAQSLKRHCARFHAVIATTSGRSILVKKKPPLKCHKCSIGFYRVNMLKQHLAEIHHDTADKTNFLYLKKWLCHDCDLMFASEKSLKDHRKSHKDGTYWFCSQCPKEITGLVNLHQHLLFHRCMMKYNGLKQPDILQVREGIRSNVYPCSVCFVLFLSQENRKQHELGKHFPDNHGATDVVVKTEGNVPELIQSDVFTDDLVKIEAVEPLPSVEEVSVMKMPDHSPECLAEGKCCVIRRPCAYCEAFGGCNTFTREGLIAHLKTCGPFTTREFQSYESASILRVCPYCPLIRQGSKSERPTYTCEGLIGHIKTCLAFVSGVSSVPSLCYCRATAHEPSAKRIQNKAYTLPISVPTQLTQKMPAVSLRGCPYCGHAKREYAFTPDALNQHLKTCVSLAILKLQSDPGQPLPACPYCGIIFDSPGKLLNHCQRCPKLWRGDVQWFCPYCRKDSTFDSLRSVEKHCESCLHLLHHQQKTLLPGAGNQSVQTNPVQRLVWPFINGVGIPQETTVPAQLNAASVKDGSQTAQTLLVNLMPVECIRTSQMNLPDSDTQNAVPTQSTEPTIANPLKCNAKSFQNAQALFNFEMHHLVTKTADPIPWKCEGCDATFQSSDGLKNHFTMKHLGPTKKSIDPLKCRSCDVQPFSSVAALKEHTKKWHRNVDSTNGVEIYRKCKDCDEIFSRTEDLEAHQKTHDVEKSWTCVPCSRKLRGVENLHKHLLFHKCLVKYKKKKSGPSSTGRHVRMPMVVQHAGDSQTPVYPCPICFELFTSTELRHSHEVEEHQPVIDIKGEEQSSPFEFPQSTVYKVRDTQRPRHIVPKLVVTETSKDEIQIVSVIEPSSTATPLVHEPSVESSTTLDVIEHEPLDGVRDQQTVVNPAENALQTHSDHSTMLMDGARMLAAPKDASGSEMLQNVTKDDSFAGHLGKCEKFANEIATQDNSFCRYCKKEMTSNSPTSFQQHHITCKLRVFGFGPRDNEARKQQTGNGDDVVQTNIDTSTTRMLLKKNQMLLRDSKDASGSEMLQNVTKDDRISDSGQVLATKGTAKRPPVNNFIVCPYCYAVDGSISFTHQSLIKHLLTCDYFTKIHFPGNMGCTRYCPYCSVSQQIRGWFTRESLVRHLGKCEMFANEIAKGNSFCRYCKKERAFNSPRSFRQHYTTCDKFKEHCLKNYMMAGSCNLMNVNPILEEPKDKTNSKMVAESGLEHFEFEPARAIEPTTYSVIVCPYCSAAGGSHSFETLHYLIIHLRICNLFTKELFQDKTSIDLITCSYCFVKGYFTRSSLIVHLETCDLFVRFLSRDYSFCRYCKKRGAFNSPKSFQQHYSTCIEYQRDCLKNSIVSKKNDYIALFNATDDEVKDDEVKDDEVKDDEVKDDEVETNKPSEDVPLELITSDIFIEEVKNEPDFEQELQSWLAEPLVDLKLPAMPNEPNPIVASNERPVIEEQVPSHTMYHSGEVNAYQNNHRLKISNVINSADSATPPKGCKVLLPKCLLCDLVFSDDASLEEHNSSYHREMFTCIICKEVFISEEDIGDHMAQHDSVQASTSGESSERSDEDASGLMVPDIFKDEIKTEDDIKTEAEIKTEEGGDCMYNIVDMSAAPTVTPTVGSCWKVVTSAPSDQEEVVKKVPPFKIKKSGNGATPEGQEDDATLVPVQQKKKRRSSKKPSRYQEDDVAEELEKEGSLTSFPTEPPMEKFCRFCYEHLFFSSEESFQHHCTVCERASSESVKEKDLLRIKKLTDTSTRESVAAKQTFPATSRPQQKRKRSSRKPARYRETEDDKSDQPAASSSPSEQNIADAPRYRLTDDDLAQAKQTTASNVPDESQSESADEPGAAVMEQYCSTCSKSFFLSSFASFQKHRRDCETSTREKGKRLRGKKPGREDRIEVSERCLKVANQVDKTTRQITSISQSNALLHHASPESLIKQHCSYCSQTITTSSERFQKHLRICRSRAWRKQMEASCEQSQIGRLAGFSKEPDMMVVNPETSNQNIANVSSNTAVSGSRTERPIISLVSNTNERSLGVGCPYCGVIYSSLKWLAQHYQNCENYQHNISGLKRSSNNKMKGNISNAVVGVKAAAEPHLKQHCPYCSQMIITSSELFQKHLSNCQSRPWRKEQMKKAKKKRPFECRYCGVIHSSQDLFIRHYEYCRQYNALVQNTPIVQGIPKHVVLSSTGDKTVSTGIVNHKFLQKVTLKPTSSKLILKPKPPPLPPRPKTPPNTNDIFPFDMDF